MLLHAGRCTVDRLGQRTSLVVESGHTAMQAWSVPFAARDESTWSMEHRVGRKWQGIFTSGESSFRREYPVSDKPSTPSGAAVGLADIRPRDVSMWAVG